MNKNLLKFIIFLILLGGIGFWIFRVIDFADKNKNESAAISTLQSIISAQKTLFPKQSNSDCASLQELLDKQMIDSKLKDGIKAGYIFTITQSEKKCEIFLYPENATKGTRSFYSTNEDNWKIHFSGNLTDKANISFPTLSLQNTY